MSKDLDEIAAQVEGSQPLIAAAKARRSATEWKNTALRLQADLEAAERRLEIMTALRERTAEKPYEIKSRKKSGTGEATAVALASDWHPEEIVTLAATNGLNEHNLEIADRKIRAYFEHVVKLIQHSRQGSEIRSLVLALLGDFMSGHIHEDLVEITALSPTETSLWVQQRIEAGIRYLLENADLREIVIPCCIGNHGRTTKQPRITTAIKHSYEWLIYKNLENTFRNERSVRFEVAKGYHVFLRVHEMTMRFHHGDAIMGNGGVGGITIPVNKALAQWDKAIKADMDCMGHHHQEIVLPRAVMNGSLIGWNPFGNWIKAAFEKPSQTFFLMSAERRRRTAIFPIFLE